MTGMDDFDVWIDEANKRTREVSNELKYHERGLAEAELAVENCRGLNKAEKLISNARRTRQRLEKIEDKVIRINEVILEINEIMAEAEKHEKLLEAEPLITDAEKAREKTYSLMDQLELIDEHMRTELILNMALQSHAELVDEFVLAVRKLGKCPTCLSPAKQSMEKRFRNEISITE